MDRAREGQRPSKIQLGAKIIAAMIPTGPAFLYLTIKYTYEKGRFRKSNPAGRDRYHLLLGDLYRSEEETKVAGMQCVSFFCFVLELESAIAVTFSPFASRHYIGKNKIKIPGCILAYFYSSL